MIYLIGGPPKCGKTTLAKKLSKKLGIPVFTTAELETRAKKSLPQRTTKADIASLYPLTTLEGTTNDEIYSYQSPQTIANNYIRQSKTKQTAAEINTFVGSYIANETDCIVEGYHITPALVAKLKKLYRAHNIQALFLVRYDAQAFVEHVEAHTKSSDWVLKQTVHKDTYTKIGKMIVYFSVHVKKEAKQYGCRVFNIDIFETQLKKAIEYFS